ncbi:MAG: LysR family transcriptional regulator [Alphaproteobacteria bacterium]|nr:LysR family transcriptional regulator [Alphaproteobacteria bacterium]
MDRLDALRVFVRVADAGSFSRAGADLGLAQPVVSRAIAALEERLGVRLFLRSTRRVALTDAGVRALERARALVEDHDAFAADMRGADRAPVGLLRISSSAAFAQDELAPHLGAFLSAYPHLKIDLAVSDARIDLVAEGVDLAFRFGDLEDSSLVAHRLGAYRRIVAASPDFLSAYGPIATPDDLARAPAIVFANTPFVREWPLVRAGGETARIEIDGRLRVSSGALVRQAAFDGLGCVFAPSFLLREALSAGRLVRILPAWEGPLQIVHAVWASGRRLPRKARVFLDHIAPLLRMDASNP